MDELFSATIGCLLAWIVVSSLMAMDVKPKWKQCEELGYHDYRDEYCVRTLANGTRESQKLSYLLRQ